MKSTVTPLEYAFWLLGFGAHVAVVWLIRARGLQDRFRWTRRHELAYAMQNAALFPLFMSGSTAVYFYSFYGTQCALYVLDSLVLWEVFCDSCGPTVRFRWAAAAIALCAAITIPIAWPVLSRSLVVSLLLSINKGINAIRCTALVFIVVGLVGTNRDWRRYSFGIGIGIAVSAAANLLASALFEVLVTENLVSTNNSVVLREICTAFDFCGLLIWVLTLCAPEPSDDISDHLAAEVIAAVRSEELVLADALSGKGGR